MVDGGLLDEYNFKMIPRRPIPSCFRTIVNTATWNNSLNVYKTIQPGILRDIGGMPEVYWDPQIIRVRVSAI